MRPKTKLGLPDLDHSKRAVLDSLRLPESKRGCDRQSQTERIGQLRLEFGFPGAAAGAVAAAGLAKLMDFIGRVL